MTPSTVTPLAALLTLLPRVYCQIAGPVIASDFPDPSIVQVDGEWWAFATRTNYNNNVHIPMASSPDFNTWTESTFGGSLADALPNLPSWVDEASSNTWAPDVNQLADGSFIMYFCASTVQDTSKHCIGAAKSSSISGPYTATSNTPLFCPLSAGGAIDPSGFLDPATNQRYVVYKIDGNSIGHGGACGNTVAPIVSTPIMLQAVAADGITLQGNPVQLLDNNGAADSGITEAPSLVRSSSGEYVLFFSTGCYSGTNYDTQVATASSVAGPYTRQGNLLVTGEDGLTSPGGADIHTDGQHMLFHANYGNGRALYTALVNIQSSSVSIG